MKYIPIIFFFFLVCTTYACAEPGGYTVEPYSPQLGPTDTSGADGTESFWDLPLWIQIGWIISALAAGFGVFKFGPLVFGKVRIILQNKNRTVILEYIGNNPGCTLTDLSKNTGLNRGTARYHLSVLIIEQKVVRKKDGKLSYLFINGGTLIERKRMCGYIMNPSKREMLDLILKRPGISNKEIAEHVQLDRSTVFWHLQQFLDEKMVISRWDGRSRNYFLFPDVEDFLRNNRK